MDGNSNSEGWGQDQTLTVGLWQDANLQFHLKMNIIPRDNGAAFFSNIVSFFSFPLFASLCPHLFPPSSHRSFTPVILTQI